MSEYVLHLSDLPLAARLARRGRPVVHVAEEANVSPAVWSRLEEGRAISLTSLLLITGYLGTPVLIDPADAKHPWVEQEKAKEPAAKADEQQELATPPGGLAESDS